MKDTQAEQLEKIAEEVEQLSLSPLYDYRKQNGYQSVAGEGDPHAAIMLIGEAPGENEAKSGRPFVGAAGRILDDLFESIRLRRADVYITSVLKDRPPDNRDPTQAEIQLYGPFLMRQIDVIRPKVIVTLGRFAMEFILRQLNVTAKPPKISDAHGKMLESESEYGHITIIPLYHPAVAFYDEQRKEALHDDFQLLRQFVPGDNSD